MKKIWVIIKREYLVRVRTRAFVIGTIVSPLLLLALIILPTFLAERGGGGERRVTVLDQSADPVLFNAIKARVESIGADSAEPMFRSSTRFVLDRQTLSPDESPGDWLKRDTNLAGKNGSERSYLILAPGVLDNAATEYHAKNLSDFSIRTLEETVSGESKEGGMRQDFMIAFALLFFLYITVLFYGLFVMRGVIEEKQSRIVEVLISSVRPTQMMVGKLIGIGLVGLTQIGIWALSTALLSTVGVAMFAGPGARVPNVPVSLLVYFVLFFILGFFLFATLYAAVGAIVSSEEDAQQVQFPVTMLLVVPMMIFGLVMANPNSTSSIVLSMVPFFAPTLMMLRIAVTNPPVWEVILSMLIMLATIAGMLWVAAKIYRVGILMYGKRPNMAELGRWLRYS